jgi:hypothetical protein
MFKKFFQAKGYKDLLCRVMLLKIKKNCSPCTRYPLRSHLPCMRWICMPRRKNFDAKFFNLFYVMIHALNADNRDMFKLESKKHMSQILYLCSAS